jgi:hypothetical protein
VSKELRILKLSGLTLSDTAINFLSQVRAIFLDIVFSDEFLPGSEEKFNSKGFVHQLLLAES